jgi:hypothetical protein
VKLDRALQVAHKARIRRYALPARNNAASSSEPSPPERGSDGRYLRGHLPSSPGGRAGGMTRAVYESRSRIGLR